MAVVMQGQKIISAAGWGGIPHAECAASRPEHSTQLDRVVKANAASLLAYGQGRSYGDAALNPHGLVLTERLARLLAFDEAQGILTAQAGVTLADLMAFAVPKGWMLPILPGTQQASLGGAIACNVHGKNHYHNGSFSSCVAAIHLLAADGHRYRCTHEENAALFWATLGGMGLTGIIEAAEIMLMPIQSASLRCQTRRVNSLEAMLECFDASKDEADYRVGWIDHFAPKERLGRGVFEQTSHISEAEGGAALAAYRAPRSKMRVPFYAPSVLLNRYVMALYNRRRFRRYSEEWREEIQNFSGFFHPLDAISGWNRLYGKRGFYQYQCLLPEGDQCAAQLRRLLETLQEHKLFSYLAVLKHHGKADASYLGFCQPGYSLALDFPGTPTVAPLVAELNAQVREAGGRVYLAKDALLSAEDFAAMYADGLTEWRSVLAQIDPGGRFDSLMALRLKMRGET